MYKLPLILYDSAFFLYEMIKKKNNLGKWHLVTGQNYNWRFPARPAGGLNLQLPGANALQFAKRFPA